MQLLRLTITQVELRLLFLHFRIHLVDLRLQFADFAELVEHLLLFQLLLVIKVLPGIFLILLVLFQSPRLPLEFNLLQLKVFDLFLIELVLLFQIEIEVLELINLLNQRLGFVF